MNFTIRPPRQSEWPICRMLIPDAFKTNGYTDFRLAVQEGSPRIIGAAAFRHNGSVMHSVMVHVLPIYRRCGTGTALIQHLFVEARQNEDRELTATVDITSESAVEAFLLANGFVRKEILHTVEGDLAPVREELTSLREQMVYSGTIHHAARIAPVDESNEEPALQLYAEYIARNRHVPVPLLKLGPADLVHSRALMIEDRMEGMLLGNVEGSIGSVAAMVITPPYRHGWAAVLLLAASLESAWAAGARRVRFDFLDGNIDMLNVHLKTETVRVLANFVCPLKGA